jgi:probable phosphoglycerate mutase
MRPPGACELLLVRHGESAPAVVGEPFPLVDGQGDPALDPVGVAQAERLAERLADEDVDAIYVTNLRRTAQTAAPLATRLRMEVRVEPDLREVHLGEWEGGVFRERVAEGDPIAARMLEEQRWDVIPGAEPAEAFAARVRAAITRIAAAHRDKTVVVVSHGGTIGQILADAARARPFAFTGADNASVSHLVVHDDRWILRRYNDTAHLGLAFTTAPEPLT